MNPCERPCSMPMCSNCTFLIPAGDGCAEMTPAKARNKSKSNKRVIKIKPGESKIKGVEFEGCGQTQVG